MGIYDREYYRGETRASAWWSGASPVCNALIIINAAVFLFQNFAKLPPGGEVISTWFAASAEETFQHFKLWQLVTATFFHRDIFHLLFNMWFFWLVAREMEPLYGSRDFLAFYLSAGVFSSFIWVLFAWLSNNPATAIGASGAVTAVGMLFTLYYPKREMVLVVIPMPMWMLTTIFIIHDLIPSLTGVRTNVAVEAHLAGAAFGFLFKHFDLRFSRLVTGRAFRPRLRIFTPVPREPSRSRSPSPSRSTASIGAGPKSPSVSVLPEEQLDARLDEVLAKIAREGRSGLTEEELRVLQEASRRAHQAERPAVNDALVAPLSIREAGPSDLPVIAEFNRLLAFETEAKVLDPAILTRGVVQALTDPDRIRYWVAAVPGASDLAGQAAITREWSDWRNGWIWWLQSVYVAEPYRRQGIFRALYRHIHACAQVQPDVIGLRLYVEDANERAQKTYQSLGMKPGGYSVYQDLWIERFQSP